MFGVLKLSVSVIFPTVQQLSHLRFTASKLDTSIFFCFTSDRSVTSLSIFLQKQFLVERMQSHPIYSQRNKVSDTEQWMKHKTKMVMVVGSLLAGEESGRMFYHLFPACAFFFFRSGNELAHASSTLYARISPQWFSKLRRLWPNFP